MWSKIVIFGSVTKTDKIFLLSFSGKFCNRSSGFCALWVLTNFLFIRALAALGSTEVIALFATNVSFVYLLSWVVLHEQFVGIRVISWSQLFFHYFYVHQRNSISTFFVLFVLMQSSWCFHIQLMSMCFWLWTLRVLLNHTATWLKCIHQLH